MARELTGWLAGSARFRAFSDAYRDKIRKKFHGAIDAEAVRDVRAELQTARLLLADRRIDVAFEAYGSGKVGPDLTVTFRATRAFNLEVTRPRRVLDAAGTGLALLAKAPPVATECRDGADRHAPTGGAGLSSMPSARLTKCRRPVHADTTSRHRGSTTRRRLA
jgi:hypothetical protein